MGRGDAKLRRSFSEKMQELMHKAASRPVEDIVDLACSTGLSSVELQQAFPRASITGVDLSPYFISVAKVMQRQRQVSPVAVTALRPCKWSRLLLQVS